MKLDRNEQHCSGLGSPGLKFERVANFAGVLPSSSLFAT